MAGYSIPKKAPFCAHFVQRTGLYSGKPVAVSGERRGIIASASYEARTLGIFTPMPTSRARKLCPRLIILPGDFDKYEHFSRWMFSYAQDFTPDVEIASIDGGYFDRTDQVTRIEWDECPSEEAARNREKLLICVLCPKFNAAGKVWAKQGLGDLTRS